MEKNCQNCKKDFTLKSEDLNFYKKISVPFPTFCPDCRAQRRFSWRNERSLHKRQCDLCKKDFISVYRSDVSFPVYCHTCYTSDAWDPMAYGIDYDKSKTFFAQIKDLLVKVPRLGIWIVQCTNSDYTNISYANKNTYLSYGFRDSEDSAYVARAVALKNTYDSTYSHYSENLYECLNVDKSYGSTFIEEGEAVVDSHYLASSRNITNSIGGVNLRSVSNYFFGKKLSPESYKEKIGELDLGSRKTRNDLLDKFENIKKNSIVRNTKQVNCVNCVGDHLENAKDCYYVFDGFNLEKARYSSWVFSSKDISDVFGMGGSELVYEGVSPEEVNNCKFLIHTDSSHDIEYGLFCQSSGFLFGCVGLRSKEYCILNKKYSKEKFHELVKIIKDGMLKNPYKDQRGLSYGYGEFFPSELSSIPYNESTAQEYFPITKEESLKMGFFWGDDEARSYNVTIQTKDVPDNITMVKDSITEEVIACDHEQKCTHQCTQAFKIIPNELQFYRKMKIPLPILCPNCRHFERLSRRNPMKLWQRSCVKCKKEIMSSCSPDRPETVYCETCYQQEVY
ncbi:MAG: hypothetical protein WAV15_02510 [Minisyncoccia bacterium]